MAREIHVAITGKDTAQGTAKQPLRTISKAAQIAMPGDSVIVHKGEYREWVKPQEGGTSELSRITYEVAKGEKVVIKGSEIVKDWEKVSGSVWKAVLPNEMFGDYNPYTTVVTGDWFIYPSDGSVHTGDVYLNGKSFYEAKSLADVKKAVKRTVQAESLPFWTKNPEKILHPEDTVYQWYAEVDEDTTTIYANFQEADPTKELVEVNVRKCCFYPDRVGRDYITVRGFEMAQAATPWTPPTADQPGLLGVNWSKGWIIEDNIIHDSKCSGISIGKEETTGHNLCTRVHRKPGYQNQMESVFLALEIGWSKESIGSHIIRNNTIYDCGQNGIVGHMGCVFSEIYGNQIYNIAVKHEYYGYEIGGIKLHAAIDVHIHDNNFHNCTCGIWLDWQAQGARVSKNLFYDNDRDLFIEVTHGPHLVDNNIFASSYTLDNIAQGGAYINNLVCGTMRREPVLNRATPYHFPHSTKVKSTTFVYSGDDRWYQNIFVGGGPVYTEQSTSGTADYNGHPSSLEEYMGKVGDGRGDLELFQTIKEPVFINNNAYLGGAKAYNKEENKVKLAYNPKVRIVTEGKKTYLEMDVKKDLLQLKTSAIGTKDLEMVRIVEVPFDDADGNCITFDTDYSGKERPNKAVVGPFAKLKEGVNKIKVWG